MSGGLLHSSICIFLDCTLACLFTVTVTADSSSATSSGSKCCGLRQLSYLGAVACEVQLASATTSRMLYRSASGLSSDARFLGLCVRSSVGTSGALSRCRVCQQCVPPETGCPSLRRRCWRLRVSATSGCPSVVPYAPLLALRATVISATRSLSVYLYLLVGRA